MGHSHELLSPANPHTILRWWSNGQRTHRPDRTGVRSVTSGPARCDVGRYDRRDDARAGAAARDPLPRPSPRVGVQGQGIHASARCRAHDAGRRTRRARCCRNVDRPRRHRVVDRRGDRRRPRRSRARLPREDRSRVAGADHPRGPGVPGRAASGDCHLHSTWSDGGAPIEAMAATAMAIGHEYMVQTDHSARLTIAHGLNEQRLRRTARSDRRGQRRHRRGRARLPDPVGHGGRHPRGRLARPVRRHAGAPRRGRCERALEAAHGAPNSR